MFLKHEVDTYHNYKIIPMFLLKNLKKAINMNKMLEVPWRSVYLQLTEV